jgi:hypothetical protein
MTIARFRDGRLFVHNPMALREPVMAELESLGEVAVVYVPSAMHRIDCARYKQRYPTAQLICPSGAHAAVQRKVRVDGTIADAPRDDDVLVLELEGTGGGEGVLRVQSGTEVTLVFNDVLFNVPHQPGLTGLVLRVLGSSGGPKVTPTARLLVAKKRALLAVHLNRLSRETGLRRLIPGHGDVIQRSASEVLHAIAESL